MKKVDIFKAPRLLVIQLKRFTKSGARSVYGMMRMGGSQKNSDLVEYPVDGFDLRPFILNPDPDEEYIYDLYGVSNHMGSLHGGHYTASCKNFMNEEWFYFNDSSVGKCGDRVVSSAAYVLFYRKR